MYYNILGSTRECDRHAHRNELAPTSRGKISPTTWRPLSVYSGSSNTPQILTSTNHYKIIYQNGIYFYEISIIYFYYYFFIIKTTIRNVIMINLIIPVTALYVITRSFDNGTTGQSTNTDGRQHWQECGGDARKWTRFGRRPVALSRGTEYSLNNIKSIVGFNGRTH